MHDLHVLDGFVEGASGGGEAAAASSLRRAISEQIKRPLTSMQCTRARRPTRCGSEREGLPHGALIDVSQPPRDCGRPRARPTRASIGPIEVSRLALQVFDALANADGAPRWRDRRLRGVFLAAAGLYGVRGKDDGRPRQKAAFDILRALPVPVGWHDAEWETLAWIARFHRGAEPRPTEPRVFAAVRGPAGPGARPRRCAPAGACPASRGRHRCLENERRLVRRRPTARQGLDRQSEDSCTPRRCQTSP